MYRLYVNIAGWSELDRSNKESDIVNTLEYEYKRNKGGYYAIIRDIGNGDEPYKIIRNEQDYNEYMQFYKDKMLKELSIIELKQQILDIHEKKR